MPKPWAPPGCTLLAPLACILPPCMLQSRLEAALQPQEHTEFCPTPHWVCPGACSVCLSDPFPAHLPAHPRPPLLSLLFWPVASFIWCLACWPTSMYQDLLLQPARLQVSTSWGGVGWEREGLRFQALTISGK